MKRQHRFAVSGWLAAAMPAWLVVAVLLAAGPAVALSFAAPMSGLQEIGPNASPATGFATVTVVGSVLTIDVAWSGLVGGAASAAHIHCCIDPGTNIGVAIGLPSFPAATSGTYLRDFDLLDPAVYAASFLSNFGGGTATGASAALLTGLEAGRAYVNIHDSVFPAGEIRGNLVPEPSTWMLLAASLAGTAGLRRIRAI